MKRRRRAIILLAVLLWGGVSFFVGEYLAHGRSWVMHSDNPHIFRGKNLNIGKIYDGNGIILADLSRGTYAAGADLRAACVHWTGDLAGRVYAAVSAQFAAQMAAYDLWSGIQGWDSEMMLSISAEVQTAAWEAMRGRRGVVAIYNYRTGQILCALSAPGFDPIEAEVVEGAYVNRFLQGSYVPGSIFKTVTAAAVLKKKPQLQYEKFQCTGAVQYSDGKVTCESVHGWLDLNGALTQSCNCVFAQIAQRLGRQSLADFVADSGVLQPVVIDGVESRGGHGEFANVGAGGFAWASIGQGEDQINPAGFLAFMGAVANGGQGVRPYLVESISRQGRMRYQASTRLEEPILSPSEAQTLQKMLRSCVQNKYGEEGFAGLTVCAKSGTAQVGKEQPNAMFAGFVTDEKYPLAFFVAVEEGGYGAKTCIPILSRVLQVCKEQM